MNYKDKCKKFTYDFANLFCKEPIMFRVIMESYDEEQQNQFYSEFYKAMCDEFGKLKPLEKFDVEPSDNVVYGYIVGINNEDLISCTIDEYIRDKILPDYQEAGDAERFYNDFFNIPKHLIPCEVDDMCYTSSNYDMVVYHCWR